MKVSFDFDETLSRKDVQEYAKELISRGVEVWVLTSRYDDAHKHLYPCNPTNEDLYAVTDALGIPRGQIRFQCMELKSQWLKRSEFVWHLDDDYVEVNFINRETNTVGVHVTKPDWMEQCEILLNGVKIKIHDCSVCGMSKHPVYGAKCMSPNCPNELY